MKHLIAAALTLLPVLSHAQWGSPEFIVKESGVADAKYIAVSSESYYDEDNKLKNRLRSREVSKAEADQISSTVRRRSMAGHSAQLLHDPFPKWQFPGADRLNLNVNIESVQIASTTGAVVIRTQDGDLIYAYEEKKSNAMKAVKIWDHTLDPQGRKVADFLIPGTDDSNNHWWMMFRNSKAGETKFEIVNTNNFYLSNVFRKLAGGHGQQNIEFNSSHDALVLKGNRSWVPAYSALDHATSKPIETPLKPEIEGILIEKPEDIKLKADTPAKPHDRPRLAFDYWHQPNIEGQTAEEWITGNPTVKMNLYKMFGEKGPPIYNFPTHEVEKEKKFIRFIDEISENGVHAPLKLSDIVWNGKRWVMKRLPESNPTKLLTTEGVRANLIENLKFTTNEACRVALEVTLRKHSE